MKVETAGYTGAKNIDDFEWIPAAQSLHIFTGFIRKPTNFTKYFGHFNGMENRGNAYSYDLNYQVSFTNPYVKIFSNAAGAVDVTNEVNSDPNGSTYKSDILISAINFGRPSLQSGQSRITPSFIYETCHGLTNPVDKNYNFYHAFSPFGNIQSPWGQLYTNTTILGDFATNNEDPPQIDPNLPKKLAASDYQRAIYQLNPNFTDTEYHQLFGINAIDCPRGFGCNTSSPTQISYPYYECPSDKSLSPRYAEAEIRWTPGKMETLTTENDVKFQAKIGGGFYNNNPIPTIFDSQFYLSSPDFCNPQTNLLHAYNNFSCPAYVFERGVSANRGSNGLLPDYVANAAAGFGFLGLGGNGKGGYLDGPGAGIQPINESFWFWNFVYRENAETFPFASSFEGQYIPNNYRNTTIINPDGSKTTVSVYLYKGNNPGVELFNRTIASDEWYWDHRSCGEYPSSLPWSFGGGIFAYPDSFFEVPYYSSIGKFGFYGARFLNGKGTLLGAVNTGVFTCSLENNPLRFTDGGLNGSDSYEDLLKIAKNQQLYSNFYIKNQGLIVAFNYETITGSEWWSGDFGFGNYPQIKEGFKNCYDFFTGELDYRGPTVNDDGVTGTFKDFWTNLNTFPTVSYITNFSGGDFSFNRIYKLDPLSILGKISHQILSNDIYAQNVEKYIFPGHAQFLNDTFSKIVIKKIPAYTDTGVTGEKNEYHTSSFQINKDFYSGIYIKQLESIRARALSNNLAGGPIDFYPINQINYGFDDAREFISGNHPVDGGKKNFGVGLKNCYFINPLGSNYKSLPPIHRRYFFGTYADEVESSFASVGSNSTNGLVGYNQGIASLPYVYGGIFSDNINNLTEERFRPDYFVQKPPISGNLFKEGDGILLEINLSELNNENLRFNVDAGPSTTTIYFLGYNGVGKFKRKYSCFSPIFTQQPTDVVCKLGQAPQLRCSAVDYHTIPEDKINGKRWPEINYWVDKLKLNAGFYDSDTVYLSDGTKTTIGQQSKDKKSQCFEGIKIPKKDLLYPLSYKWGRVKKDDYYQYSLGIMSGVEWANSNGVWSCAEGDTNTCTIIHPLECMPRLNETRKISINPGEAFEAYGEGGQAYVQGVKKGIDDLYYYICLTSGRFGMRRSERAELFIENKLKFDIAIKNPSPRSISPVLTILAPHPVFENSTVPISIAASKSVGPFYGYQPNELAIKEEVIADRRTASQDGCLASWKPCCDTPKLRHLGTNGFSSWNVSWSPPAVLDTRAMNSIYGHVLHYGGLVPFETELNQSEGNYLYGSYPLPQISNGSFYGNTRGVSIRLDLGDGITVSHWAVDEVAFATDTSKEGIPFKSKDIISALYPPSEGALKYNRYPTEQVDQTYGRGHWQFSNNLGLVKKLSYKKVKEATEKIKSNLPFYDFFENIFSIFPGNLTVRNNDGSPGLVLSNYEKDREQLLKNITDSLGFSANGDAGWRYESLGRHMAYFVEGFDSFYLHCGAKKKEFVKNWSFVAAGLRVGNAGFQYSFLGLPNSSYLTRKALYGPYAYMWKLNKHNRDRNGNGMPLGMYSYSTDRPYSMMSDIPAIYGLYTFDASKTKSVNFNRKVINQIKDIRRIIWAEDQSKPNHFEFNSVDDQVTVEISPGSPGGFLGDPPPIAATYATGDVTKWCGVPNGNKNWTCSGPDPASAGGVLDPNAGPVWFCLYGGLASNLASSPDLSIYNCGQRELEAGNCFHPCLSLRYDQGLLPGGKKLDFFGKPTPLKQSNSPLKEIGFNINVPQPNRISSDAHYNYAYNSQGETVLGPINTPWAKSLETLLGVNRSNEKLKNLASIDPRFGGGCDHCNYITPTAWLGSAQNAQGYINSLQVLIKKFSN
jgi:hypothetical protein